MRPADPRTVVTDRAPASSAFLQAVVRGSLVVTSGQVGLVAETNRQPESFTDEVHQAIDNLCTVFEAAGSGLDRVSKSTCYLSDLRLPDGFNEVYEQRFRAPRPARSTVQAGLVGQFRVEIERIAVVA